MSLSFHILSPSLSFVVLGCLFSSTSPLISSSLACVAKEVSAVAVKQSGVLGAHVGVSVDWPSFFSTKEVSSSAHYVEKARLVCSSLPPLLHLLPTLLLVPDSSSLSSLVRTDPWSPHLQGPVHSEPCHSFCCQPRPQGQVRLGYSILFLPLLERMKREEDEEDKTEMETVWSGIV